jgi:hypothetical protein
MITAIDEDAGEVIVQSEARKPGFHWKAPRDSPPPQLVGTRKLAYASFAHHQ